MIDLFINRIKDAYFDLERDTARGQRFVQATEMFTPGAIRPSPSQMAQMQQQQPQMGMQQPEMGTPPAPAPEPSMLDLIGARR